MPPKADRPRYSSGNLTEAAWSALKRVKFNNTSAAMQPTQSDVVVAAAMLAERYPTEFRTYLSEIVK